MYPLANDRRRFRWLPCLASLTVLAGAAEARAATIVITPSYVQSFDSGMNGLGVLPNDGAATPVGGYLQFEFRMSLDNLAGGEDFWIVMFNLHLGPGLVNESGWLDPGAAQLNSFYPALPALGQYDSNGAAAGGIDSHWQFSNNDFGIDPNDLQSIIVEADAAEAANRQYGEAIRPAAGSADALGSPTLIGTLIVRRTELVPSQITITPIAGSPWGSYADNADGDGEFSVMSGSSFTGESIQIVVPEPANRWLSLIGAALLTIWTHSRRIHSHRISR